MKRLALIQPKGNPLSKNQDFARFWSENQHLQNSSFFAPMPNLGLLTVAALTPPGYHIDFIDENFESICFDGYDIVGLSAMTLHAERAYEIAKEFRLRGTKIVLGGIHATVLPDEASKHVDAVVVGEAENLWPRVLEDFEKEQLKKIYCESSGKPEMLHSPVPRFDLAKLHRYQAVPIQTTRGCPYDCEFCSVASVYGKKLRKKPIKQVLEEIKEVAKLRKHGKPRIFFTDDNMFLDKKHAADLLRAITPLKINWMTQCDVSLAENLELLRLIRRSGGSQLLIGFESLSDKNLKSLHENLFKASWRGRYSAAIQTIQSHGIRVLGMFMVGLDSDTPKVFDELKDFILRNHLHDVQITLPTPLPGTSLHKRLQHEGRLLKDRYWEDCSFFNVTFEPKNMTGQELAEGHLRLYKSVSVPSAKYANRRHFIEIFKNLHAHESGDKALRAEA